MIVTCKGKKIEIPAAKVSPMGKISGLMFKTKNAENLLFEFSRKTRMRIHSFFVFFPFLAVWLDEEGNAIESKIVKPFTFSAGPKQEFSKLIELPFNDKNEKIINFFVGKRPAHFTPPSVKERFKYAGSFIL